MTNLEIVKTSYELSAKGDIDSMMGLLSPDMAWTEMAGFPYGGTYIGADEILKGVFARIGADWDNFAVKPGAFYDAGDTIIVTGFYSGMYKKTGKRFEARFNHVWKLKDNKITAMEQFVDTLLVDQAINPQK